MTNSEPSYDAKGSDRDVGTVTRQGNEKFGNDLSDAQTLGADAPGPTSESHSAVHGRKIEIHEVLTTYKRKADGQNEQENRKRLRVQHTVENEHEPLFSPPVASEQPRTVMTRAHNSPHSKLWRGGMTVANGHETTSVHSSAAIIRARRGGTIERNQSFDDHKLIDPIDRSDISQFISAESEQISDEAHTTMVAKSYRKWNPWGIKAVSGTGILQEIMWDEVRKPVSHPKDGATSGENIGFTMTMQ
jgi:hypothetical protein